MRVCKTIVFCDTKPIYKLPKTDGSIRDVKLPEFVVQAVIEQREYTWKGDGNNFIFLNKAGRNIHHHTLNKGMFKPTLQKAGLPVNRSLKDTRATFITNSLDQGERLSFIQKQVGHNSTKMIIEHYHNYVPAADDGNNLEKAWKSNHDLTRPQKSEKLTN